MSMLSGDFENQNYSNYYSNSINIPESSSYIGYTNSINQNDDYVCPVIINFSKQRLNDKMDSFTININFMTDDMIMEENFNRIKVINSIRSDFDASIPDNSIKLNFDTEQWKMYLNQMLTTNQMSFKVTKLPYETINLVKSTKPKKSSFSQTPDTLDDTAEFVKHLKNEINLLKEQNSLLKSQLDSKRNSIKEYVLRKQSSDSTIHSTGTVAESTDIPLGRSHTGSTNGDQQTQPHEAPGFDKVSEKLDKPREDSLYEILQEYMLENEELRNQNDLLNKLKLRQKTDYESITRQNRELNQKLIQLTKLVSQINKPEPVQSSPRNPTQSYPIVFDNGSNVNSKHSYLRQYGILKNTPVQPIFSPKSEINRRTRNNSENDRSKSESNQNDALKDELDRIDNTIRNHIRNYKTLQNFKMKK